MRREDITKCFEGATDEQVKALLDINSADITKALGKQVVEVTTLQAKVTGLEGQLTTAKETIANLEKSKGSAEELQKQLGAYRVAEEQRKQAEVAEQLRAAVEARFTAAVGERKFVHEFVRKGVLDEFEVALKSDTSTGKSDKEIFDALTKDKEVFSSQNPPKPNMGGVKAFDTTVDLEKFRKMSLYDQMLFARQHPDQAEVFLKQEG